MRNRKIILTVIIIIIVLLLLLSMILPAVMAAGSNQTKINDLKNQLEQLAKKQKELEQEIKDIRSQQKTKLQQKEQLDKEINITSSQVDVMNNLVSELAGQIETKEKEIKDTQSDIDARNDIYLKRIRASYEAGPVSYIEVVLGASSFSDFLNRVGMIEDIMAYDQSLISQMESDKQKLEDAKIELEKAQNEKKLLLKDLQAKQASLKSKYEQTDQIIAQLKQNEKDYAEAYEKAEKEQEKLNAEIARLIAQQGGTSYVGGDFIWPLPGYTNISSEFGMRFHPVLKKNKLHTGVDIPAPSGTKILAANAGTVISQGYNAGYGNYIVINHGGGLTTLYGHMKVPAYYREGQYVKKGAVIGLVGTTGYSTGNHLHFEISKNGTPVNPMSYYKKQ